MNCGVSLYPSFLNSCWEWATRVPPNQPPNGKCWNLYTRIMNRWFSSYCPWLYRSEMVYDKISPETKPCQYAVPRSAELGVLHMKSPWGASNFIQLKPCVCGSHSNGLQWSFSIKLNIACQCQHTSSQLILNEYSIRLLAADNHWTGIQLVTKLMYLSNYDDKPPLTAVQLFEVLCYFEIHMHLTLGWFWQLQQYLTVWV